MQGVLHEVEKDVALTHHFLSDCALLSVLISGPFLSRLKQSISLATRSSCFFSSLCSLQNAIFLPAAPLRCQADALHQGVGTGTVLEHGSPLLRTKCDSEGGGMGAQGPGMVVGAEEGSWGRGGFAQRDTRGGRGVVGAQGHHVPVPGLMWVSRQVLGRRCCSSGASPSSGASCPPARASSTWGASWGLAQHSPQTVSSEVSLRCPLGVPLVPAGPHTPAARTPQHCQTGPTWAETSLAGTHPGGGGTPEGFGLFFKSLS